MLDSVHVSLSHLWILGSIFSVLGSPYNYTFTFLICANYGLMDIYYRIQVVSSYKRMEYLNRNLPRPWPNLQLFKTSYGPRCWSTTGLPGTDVISKTSKVFLPFRAFQRLFRAWQADKLGPNIMDLMYCENLWCKIGVDWFCHDYETLPSQN